MKPKNRLLLVVVLALMGMTGVFIGVVAIRVVEASGDETVRRGLDYERFLAAVDELVEGAGDDALIRFETVEGDLGRGRRVTFDTLVIEADPASPGLTLINTIAQEEAARLLADSEDYFGD